MALPFETMTLTFSKVNYFVTAPPVRPFAAAHMPYAHDMKSSGSWPSAEMP